MGLKSLEWEDLLHSIENKECIPFIGMGASAPWDPVSELATDLAEKAIEYANDKDYPLEDSSQLSRVAQFVAIADGSEMTPKNILSRKLERIKVPDFSLEKNRNTPYAVLADLNLPIYVTTNYDYFLEEALRSRGKNPVSEFCPWNKNLKEYIETLDKPMAINKKYSPDESNPLVYHLYGDFKTPGSMILTRRDFLDFVIYLSKESDTVLPSVIRRALPRGTLLFVGHDLKDENFLVIFQGVINLISALGERKSIAVQFTSNIDPSKKDQIKKVENYLDQYTHQMFKIRTYWGNASDFSNELRSRLDNYRNKD